MKTLTIEIKPDGSVTLDAKGFTGTDCQKFTAAYEQALGKTTARQFKPEAHTQTTTQAKASR